MNMMKKIIASLGLVALLLAIPVGATEPVETLPPLVIGVRELAEVPKSWNPLTQPEENQRAILELTSLPLYHAAENGVEPAQAAGLPEDVTGEFAGTFGLSAYATRGYAFAVSLREELYWENGEAVTATDWLYTLEHLLTAGTLPLELANYGAYLAGATYPATEIISLLDAGYDSLEAAQTGGIEDFYLDTTNFWGLDTGWLRITDRTRLLDSAIPSGCEEMYVTPAYLYREYLSGTGTQTMFQTEFLGIPAEAGEKLTLADVGLLVREDRLILILEEPATAQHVAWCLAGLYPVPLGANPETYGTAENYSSCGPFYVESVQGKTIRFLPNPHWQGEKAEYDEIRCEKAS